MERDIRKSEQTGHGERKPYETPMVTDLGNVEELTKGSATTGTDAGASA